LERKTVERLLRPRFVLDEETVKYLEMKFNASDVERVISKLEVVNRGAGKVKPYPNYDDTPRGGGTVWAIRLNKQVRILAQEGVESGHAHVFDVLLKSEIEKE
jgi:hypothetical protein